LSFIFCPWVGFTKTPLPSAAFTGGGRVDFTSPSQKSRYFTATYVKNKCPKVRSGMFLNPNSYERKYLVEID
jgi:hypothetical protein